MTAFRQNSTLIRFDGDWSASDRSRVRQAIKQLDFATSSSMSTAEDFTWLCVRQEQGTDCFYFAHWLHRPLVLTAPTADQLARKITDLSPSDFS